jgi:hypothetical protein
MQFRAGRVMEDYLDYTSSGTLREKLRFKQGQVESRREDEIVMQGM